MTNYTSRWLSTPSVYSSYVGREVKFYDTDVLHVDNDDDELYTLDKTKKSDDYFKFLDYIHAVFETKKPRHGLLDTKVSLTR